MSSSPPAESTALLLRRVRDGEDAAREELVARYLPMLRRWATGRLPPHARGTAETDDLVQVTLLRALDSIDRFEPRREGAFLAYLRRILLNQMRDEIRRAARRPQDELLEERLASPEPSAVERAIGSQAMERYEAALAELPEVTREALVLRLEFGYGHREVAEAVGLPSADAARMTVARAVVRVAEALR